MKKPCLSIIIPAYNVQSTIGACLDSVLYQSGAADYEIIVVDDGSTDNTKNILQQYKLHAPNINVITQQNGGVSAARNTGIAAANADFITFVDADDMVGLDYHKFRPYMDYAEPEYYKDVKDANIDNMHVTYIYYQPWALMSIPVTLERNYFKKLLNPMLYDENIDITFGGKITSNIQKMYLLRHVYNAPMLYGSDIGDKQKMLMHADVRESANFAVYRRDLLTRNNIRFMSNMILDEDMLFCQLAVLHARNILTVPDCTYLYNRHAGSLSLQAESENPYTYAKKTSIAWIQRYSVLLDTMRKNPQYAQLYKIWLSDFASFIKSRARFHLSYFPPTKCGKCSRDVCTQCPMQKQIQSLIDTNIKTFVSNTR